MSTEWGIIVTSIETLQDYWDLYPQEKHLQSIHVSICSQPCLLKTSNLWFLFPMLIVRVQPLPTSYRPQSDCDESHDKRLVLSETTWRLCCGHACDMSTCTFSLADDTVILWCNCCSQMEEFWHSVVYSRRALGSHSSSSVGGPPGRCSALEPFPRQPFFFHLGFEMRTWCDC